MATDSPPPLSPPSRPSSALSMRSEDTDFTNQTESSENSDINADDPPPRRIRSKIYKREGKCCILCGTPGDEVAGGVIRLAEWRNNSHEPFSYLWRQALVPKDWSRDDPGNLIYVCGNHIAAWYSGAVTFCPTPQDRTDMLVHELADADRRMEGWAPGLPRPDRTVADQLSGQVMLLVCRPYDIDFAHARPGSLLHTWQHSPVRPVTLTVPLNPYVVWRRACECAGGAYVPCEPDVELAEKDLVDLRDAFNLTLCHRATPKPSPYISPLDEPAGQSPVLEPLSLDE